MKWTIKADRIGRNHDVRGTITTPVCDGQALVDALAESVHRFARKRLTSRDFEVAVELLPEPEGLVTHKGSIESGRYGTFTIEPEAA